MYFLSGHPRVAEFVLVDASNGGVRQWRRFQRELENLSSREYSVRGAETREQAWTIPSLSCRSMEGEGGEVLLLSQKVAMGRDGWTAGFRCRG